MELAKTKDIDGQIFERLVICGVERLKEQVGVINDLNVFPIPDGDTGDNMLSTISGGLTAMKKVRENSIGKKAKALSDEMLLHARGNSGVIFSQFFYGLSCGLNGLDVADMNQITAALKEGVKKGYSSVVKPVEGTMLTVAREAAEKSADHIDENTDLLTFAEDYVSEMKESLKRTPDLLYVLKEAGVVDSGGAGLLCMAEGVKDAITGGGDEIAATETTGDTAKEVDLDKFTEDSVMEFGYCTEFLLRLQKIKTDVSAFDVKVIIDYLNTIGDSIVAFKTGTIIKVHVHTLTPHKALEFCQQFGEFLTVKIENMTLQHNETAKEKKNDIRDEFKVKKARKEYGLCTVASGEGLKAILLELGADAVVDGGQTKNPSVGDFLKAFDEINAENIFVLPNNKNIIMAAQSAADIYEGGKVFVIPTKDVGQGYSALSMLDYSGSPKEIAERLKSDSEDVVTGMVTNSVRDADINGVNIKKGDYIGFTDKTMLSSTSDKVKTAIDLVEKLGGDEKTLATVIYGVNATEEDRKRLYENMTERFKNIETYEIDGGQEVYDFILMIE